MTQTLHHPKSTRPARRRAARRARRRSWIPITGIVAAIVIAAVIAVMLAGGSTPTSGVHETASVSIEGTALPAPASPDVAIGMRAPIARGMTFGGASVQVPAPGKPTIIAFLAHWCPHCRKDVPVIQAWLDRNGMPADVELRTVSTWVDASRPNYPPSTWLRDERWTPPVLVDDANGSTAAAYGLQGTPMWVFVGKDGVVKFRIGGELTGTQFEQALQRLRAA